MNRTAATKPSIAVSLRLAVQFERAAGVLDSYNYPSSPGTFRTGLYSGWVSISPPPATGADVPGASAARHRTGQGWPDGGSVSGR
jgi:hypothetical protein